MKRILILIIIITFYGTVFSQATNFTREIELYSSIYWNMRDVYSFSYDIDSVNYNWNKSIDRNFGFDVGLALNTKWKDSGITLKQGVGVMIDDPYGVYADFGIGIELPLGNMWLTPEIEFSYLWKIYNISDTINLNIHSLGIKPRLYFYSFDDRAFCIRLTPGFGYYIPIGGNPDNAQNIKVNGDYEDNLLPHLDTLFLSIGVDFLFRF